MKKVGKKIINPKQKSFKKSILQKLKPQPGIMAKNARVNVDLIQDNLNWLNPMDYKIRWQRKFKQSTMLVCNFELKNGHHTTCILPIKDSRVIYHDGTYIIDDALKYYHLGFKEWCLDFHEGFSMPIKRKIPLNELNVALQESGIGNIGFATNPSTLRTFQVNDVVKSAIQAAGITDFFKQVRLLVIVSALASVVMLILWANSEGYFSGMTG